jgi:hypothetical protein
VESPSAPLAEAPHLHAALAADPNKLVIVRNLELSSTADNNTASHVGEPSVSSNNNVVFYTGNWYAAMSSDGGASFRYVDPFNSFPNPEGMEFCCDQVVHYVPSIDTFVWLMQYTEKPGGGNIQRLAFAKTADVAQGRWRLYDIDSESLGIPKASLISLTSHSAKNISMSPQMSSRETSGRRQLSFEYHFQE